MNLCENNQNIAAVPDRNLVKIKSSTNLVKSPNFTNNFNTFPNSKLQTTKVKRLDFKSNTKKNALSLPELKLHLGGNDKKRKVESNSDDSVEFDKMVTNFDFLVSALNTDNSRFEKDH